MHSTALGRCLTLVSPKCKHEHEHEHAHAHEHPWPSILTRKHSPNAQSGGYSFAEWAEWAEMTDCRWTTPLILLLGILRVLPCSPFYIPRHTVYTWEKGECCRGATHTCLEPFPPLPYPLFSLHVSPLPCLRSLSDLCIRYIDAWCSACQYAAYVVIS